MRDTLTKLVLAAAMLGACGPGRSTFARYPAAATAFDRAGSDPKALAIADKVVAAAGGAERWSQARQVKWSEEYVNNGKVVLAMGEAWDRWNGRHHTRLHKAGDATYSVEASHNPTQSKRSGEGDVVVMRKLYEDGGAAFFDSGHGLAALNAPDVPRAVSTARERWQFDTAALCMPFLLEEPGAKLAYAGEVAGEAGKPPLDDLKLTLDPRDPSRTSTYHVMVNRETSLIDRIEIVEAGQPDNRRIAFHLGPWVEVNGLKFPAAAENVGVKGEVITFKDIATGEPDEALYVPQVL
jgi:hypothetical protein